MFKDIQKEVHKYASKRDPPYMSPLSLVATIAEEVGELARYTNHLYGDKPKKTEEARQDLGQEMCDVIHIVVAYANREGISLDKEWKRMISEKFENRDKNRFIKLEEKVK